MEIELKCSVIKPEKNKMLKGEKAGDSIKVGEYGSYEIPDFYQPTIDNKVKYHGFEPKGNNVERVELDENGNKIENSELKAPISKKRYEEIMVVAEKILKETKTSENKLRQTKSNTER